MSYLAFTASPSVFDDSHGLHLCAPGAPLVFALLILFTHLPPVYLKIGNLLVILTFGFLFEVVVL
jgi:hypothetical protein